MDRTSKDVQEHLGCQNSLDMVVIDDDQYLLDMVSYRLETGNLIYRCFSDSLVALKFLATHTPRVLLIDFSMPKLNGIAVLERFKTLIPSDTCAVYLCSAFTLPGEIEIKALQLGARALVKDRLLEKDFLERLCRQSA